MSDYTDTYLLNAIVPHFLKYCYLVTLQASITRYREYLFSLKNDNNGGQRSSVHWGARRRSWPKNKLFSRNPLVRNRNDAKRDGNLYMRIML